MRESSPFSASRWTILLAGCLLVFSGLAVYHNSFSVPFIFDDIQSIPENPTIQRFWPLGPVLSLPQDGGLTVGGRPLLNLSLAVNYAIGGLAVRSYHALNLAIHILAGLTLFGIVRRTLRLCSGQALRLRSGPAMLQPVLRARLGAASLPLGLAVALLWTIHPLQTEAVTYVVQRAESLMGLFYLLTLYCFIRGVESPAPLQSRGWHILSIAACLAGMATKEVMVSAPLMVLLYDRTFVSGTFREAWRRHRRFYLGLAGAWLLLGYLVAGTGNRGGTAGFGLGIAWWAYPATQFRAIVRYLCLSVWPHPLVLDYGTYWVRRVAEVASYVPPVVLLVAGALVGLQRRTVIGFAGCWFFAILAPTSLVPGTIQMIVEHRMYLPLAAVIAVAVPGIYALAGQRSLFLFLALAVGLGVLASRRNADYRSAVAIWSDTVRKRPDSARAHGNLGYVLAQAGRVPEAMEHYEKALRIKPDDAKAHYNLGSELFEMGRGPEAIGHFEEALRIKPDFTDAHINLGNVLLQAGRVPEAIWHYEEALRIKPDNAKAHLNFGIALTHAGRVSEAIEHYEKTLRTMPDSVEAHNDLGTALAQTGRIEEAIGHFEEALRLRPDYAGAHYNLGLALFKAGRGAEAIGHFEEALRIDPHDAETHNSLGNVLLETGRLAEAKEHYQEALRIRPDYLKARNSLTRLQALEQASPGGN